MGDTNIEYPGENWRMTPDPDRPTIQVSVRADSVERFETTEREGKPRKKHKKQKPKPPFGFAR